MKHTQVKSDVPRPDFSQSDCVLLEARKAGLAVHRLVAEEGDAALDEIVSLAAHICETPAAGIALLKPGPAALISVFGLDPENWTQAASLSEVTVLTGAVHEIADLRRHPELASSHSLGGEEQYPFYAGAPLLDRAGTGMGALFVLDSSPRSLNPLQTEALTALSHQIVTHFELQRSRYELRLNASDVPLDATRSIDRMKDEFIATISHECRTPLTSLRAALGLIAGGALKAQPEKMNQMLDIAIRNTNRLVGLVNDILDLDRIESGRSQLHRTMVSAGDLFRRAAALHPDENLRITLRDGDVPLWADFDRILQALSNLIVNAIKFAPGSEIELSAKMLDDEVAEICICDHGAGIPAAKLEHIFERFHQVDSSDSRASSGSGLGLALCRTIITQHGGRIWATSKPDEGTTLHFTLPTHPPR